MAMRRHNGHRHWLDVPALLTATLGLYIFFNSFFLAKRNLGHVSKCDEAASLLQDSLGLSVEETNLLVEQGILSSSKGCWLDRGVDSVIFLVVDALRFDFALHHLPKSVGQRLNDAQSSRLLKFIADPPTVTMQRLKALSTGGLPTFADISSNMGGASVEEDSWVVQLRTTNYTKRGMDLPTRMAFVGDDTWEDLFPGLFHESHPYPSFNTRDLNTVDDGCLSHLPDLLKRIRKTGLSEDELEVIVVHFLGVDHVGHTYGPHNEHMDWKLRQMDDALTNALQVLDDSDHCHAALIFGDHGMTEDGNHGGGTDEEVTAALFVHFSSACRQNMTWFDPSEVSASAGDFGQTAFESIHQIDLVPTLSLLLGLPIPYANLGGMVPLLVPHNDVAGVAASLALNRAQIWRYLSVYSRTANKLPSLQELEESLKLAVATYKEALSYPKSGDSLVFRKACHMFKVFLADALALGQQVWTRFDTVGMTAGASILFIGVCLWIWLLLNNSAIRGLHIDYRSAKWELAISLLFIIFHCGVLSFGNSYILEEQHILMFMVSVLSCLIFLQVASRCQSHKALIPMLIPMASRAGELLVTGHGLDPSTIKHAAHNTFVFIACLTFLASARYFAFRNKIFPSLMHCILDCAAFLCLGVSWIEKRSADPALNGFLFCQAAIICLGVGMLLSMGDGFFSLFNVSSSYSRTPVPYEITCFEQKTLMVLIKFVTAIMVVTGPSSAATTFLYVVQVCSIYWISKLSDAVIHPIVLAALWRFITRHTFFATNHGCSFSLLQLSAAFVATSEFNYAFAGTSLFTNTFGWEIMGLGFAFVLSSDARLVEIWRWFICFQLLETFCSCISVSVLRRHLMVWDIYAPHFLFAAVFVLLHVVSCAFTSVKRTSVNKG